MTDKSQPQGDAAGVKIDPENPPIGRMVAQYVKDLSFESPNAPKSFELFQQQSPQISVDVNIQVKNMGEDHFEVGLKISADAKQGDSSAFVVELDFAGLFLLKNIPEQSMQPFLMIQAPTMLFPFARRIIADATRDGGYPPLLLEAIDFVALYQQQQQAAAAQQAEATKQ